MTEPFIGEIRLVGFNYVPKEWMKCNGQILLIRQYSALFSLFGIMYGGDGITTFGIPNLNGYIPIGSPDMFGQTENISIRQPVLVTTIPAQSISFTLKNMTII
jgi:microcystin-dependent protein